MLERLRKTPWVRAPARLARKLLARRSPTSEPTVDNAYYRYLRDQYFAFMQARVPGMDRERFLAIVQRNIDPKISGSANKYVADLWDLFEPGYKQDFGPFYKWHEKLLFFRFLTYAGNERRIRENYAAAYELALQRLGHVDVLEVGGGVPHGLLYIVHQRGAAVCRRLTYVDLDVLHADFVAWYCRSAGIELRQHRVTAARAPAVPAGPYNFIFAKDVFEHLDKPEVLLDGLMKELAPDGLLAVDLEHKGEVVHQHISPDLPPLKDKLKAAGFELLATFGVLTVWARTR
jgi:methyltransferase family protein